LDRREKSLMTKPAVLLFDLGGVIVDFRGGEGMNAVTGGAYGVEFCQDQWWRLPELDRLERGAISPEEFAAAFIARWGLDLEASAYVHAFKHWVVGVYEGAPEILASLRRRGRIACLSNVNSAHWERCVELGVDRLFDACFLSHELGLRKPEPAIYEEVSKRLGVPPDDIHFFDDVPANVDAARAGGMNAALVEKGGLEAALVACGLW
jgi:putative hydrolase of the HAD superfamily